METMNQRIRDKMCSAHKYPCVWGCNNDVVAVDMPKVTCCKVCYAKMRKSKPELAKKLQTWRQLINLMQ